MVGLVVGLLVRHLKETAHLLTPYLTEPLIWNYEFARVLKETNGFAADSEGLVGSERRRWSLREAAAYMVLEARSLRDDELRLLGDTLVANARRDIESIPDDSRREAAG